MIAVDRLWGGAHFLILLQSSGAGSDWKYNTDHDGHDDDDDDDDLDDDNDDGDPFDCIE